MRRGLSHGLLLEAEQVGVVSTAHNSDPSHFEGQWVVTWSLDCIMADGKDIKYVYILIAIIIIVNFIIGIITTGDIKMLIVSRIFPFQIYIDKALS